jgi:hypothetical protein
MHLETLRLLQQLDTSPGKMKASVEAKIKMADSVHFHVLYDYVHKNGWPDIAHGSLFAGAIAMRDIIHCYDYLPIMLEAFNRGELPVVDLLFVQFNKRYYPDLVIVRGYLKGAYKQYDINCAFAGAMPSNANDIIAEVRKNCPVKNVFVLQQSPRKLYTKKVIGDYHKNHFEHFDEKWSRFNMELFNACLPWKNTRAEDDHGIYTYWLPYDGKEERLTLYVVL